MDKDIVMGVYPMSQDEKILWSVSTTEPFQGISLGGLSRNSFKILAGGFGVTLVKYEVFEALEWPYWKNVYAPGGIKMSEDIYFCEKARKADFDIWCDPLVKCDHTKYVGLLNIVKRTQLLKKGVKK